MDEIRKALSELVDPDCLDEWFDTPNAAFDGQKPSEVDLDRLWQMVYYLRSGNPA